MDAIYIAALLGALGAGLCSFLFPPRNTSNNLMKKNITNSQNEELSSKKPSLLYLWAFRLAMFGLGAGVFLAMGKGYLEIGFMIGFGIPFAVIFGIIGLIIDFINKK